jgi:Amt family ammonium transporter
MTWVILKILDATLGLRVTDEQENEGLDLAQHGERGYSE